MREELTRRYTSNYTPYNSFFDDRLLFYRERGAGVYGITPYWFSSSLAYIPQCVVASVTYCTVVYFMSGLNNAAGVYCL